MSMMLFPPEEDSTTPHGGGRGDVDTSIAAAIRLHSTGRPVSVAQRIIVKLHEAGPTGCLSDELEATLRESHQMVSARLRDLEVEGVAFKRTDTRKTRTGSGAHPYVLASFESDLPAGVYRKPPVSRQGR